MNTTNYTSTENGAISYNSSLNACCDLFFMAGASRNLSDDDIINIFSKALQEDALIASKILFWARDIRGGSGERRFFRVITNWLDKTNKHLVQKNAHLIPEYGRWDDMFELSFDLIMPIIKKGIDEKNGLLCKWLPRKGEFANKVRKALKLSPAEYRHLIVSNSNTVEQKMCAKQWEEISYSGVPSKAMNKYRKAFLRNDENRFNEFISLVETGEEKINAGAIFPHELIEKLQVDMDSAYSNEYNLKVNLEDKNVIRAVESQWNSLPNYLEDSTEKILPVADISGSMKTKGSNSTAPLNVSIALALYISERNESIFKDMFVTFSDSPKFYYLNGTLSERICKIHEDNMSTNVEAVFDKLLELAISNKLTEDYMPTKILIMSDMQFNTYSCSIEDDVMDMIERKYNNHGFKRPDIIFWNLNAKVEKVPTSHEHKGVALVSGFNTSILKSVVKGEVDTPLSFMLKTVDSDRYKAVEV